jgi:hypothetical protein
MCSIRLICEQYRGRASCTTSLPAPLGSGGNAQSSLPAFIFWSSCLSTSSCWPRPGGSPGNTQTSAHHRRAREHESTQKTIVDRMATLPAPGAGARAHFWQGGYTSGGAGERGRLHPLETARTKYRLFCLSIIIAGLTWIGLSCICISVFPHLAWVIVLWTLKTLGLAAAIPPQKALISDLTEHAQRGTGYGLSTFAASLGAAVGPLLGGWVYDSVGHVTPFFLTGIIFLASPGWVSLLLPRR